MKKLLLCASAFALMLGSCSKDDTEVASVVGSTEVAFSATMSSIGNDNDTRIGIADEGTNIIYTWDFGDMVGATVKGLSQVIPFTNVAESGPIAEFSAINSAGVNYVGSEDVYLVYPYKEGKVVDNYGKVEMTIPNIQTYRNNSVAQMTAPAVSFAENFVVNADNTTAEYTFKAVSSFIRVPVYGVGKVKSLSMKIKNGERYENIAGSAMVDVAAETPALALSSGTDKITLEMGKGNVSLDYTQPTWVVFVIPADVAIKASTSFEFQATFDDASTSNYTINIPETYKGTSLAVNTAMRLSIGAYFGVENKTLISNAADFLKYLYTVSKNTDGDKIAVLTSDIDFKSFDVQDALSGCDDETMVAALTAYQTNGLAINSIAEGANIDGNGKRIANLQVKGNGLFAGQPNVLKNVTLSGVTVTVPNNLGDTPALFIGAINLATPADGLIIGSGCYLKNVAENATAAMIQQAYNTTLATTEIAKITYPRVNDSKGAPVYYAAKLTLQGDIDASDVNMKSYFGTTRRFGEIIAGNKDVTVSGVAPLTETNLSVKHILDAVSETSTYAISVVDTKSTSYWTGGVASAAPASGEIKTAEQLAYVVKNGGSKLTLVNNIDLQGTEGKVWTVAKSTVAIDGGNKTVKNVQVGNETDVETGYYSLLGYKVTASNLKVENVTIAVENATKTAYVGGLGYTGSANGVTVSGLSIKVGDNVKAINSNLIGGLLSTMSKASEGNKVTGLTIDLGDKEGVTVGGLFGSLTNKNTTISFSDNNVQYAEAAETYPLLGAWTVYASTVVNACKVLGSTEVESTEENPIAPVVGAITFNPASLVPGTQFSLKFDNCTEPLYGEIKNAVDYGYTVKINDEEVPVSAK